VNLPVVAKAGCQHRGGVSVIFGHFIHLHDRDRDLCPFEAPSSVLFGIKTIENRSALIDVAME
jgi:hypothetical protein